MSVIEPWIITCEERKECLLDAKKSGKKIAVYFVKGPDSSTFRYRCYNTFQATNKSKEWQAVYFYRSEYAIFKEILPVVDLVILGRQSRFDALINEVVNTVHNMGKKVFFDLDDLVFDKKYLPVVMNSIGETNYSYWAPYFADIHETGLVCDGFMVTNEYLGNKIASCFGKPFFVIRNSLNDEQVAASNVYYSRKKSIGAEGFSIGYFSGSPTHRNDLEVALPEIVHFLKQHSDASLRIVGYMDMDDILVGEIKDKIEFLPMVDFRKLQRYMSEVSVNIAPLINNEFTNCKSELKFFEAAAVGTTTAASPIYSYAHAIQNGKTGFLCNQGQWFDVLELLYNDKKVNRGIAQEARKYCLKKYYGVEFLREVERAYDSGIKS